MSVNKIITGTVILLSLLVSLAPATATAWTARTPRGAEIPRLAPRFPCSPFGIATGVQQLFDAVATGHPALAVARLLGPTDSDTLFDKYQFGAYGGGIPASAPINRVAFMRSSLLQSFALRAKQHDRASLLTLRVEAVGSYRRDSIGFTVGLTRRADDLRHRALLYGVAKAGWLCGSHMLQFFLGAVLLDRQGQMRQQAAHVCPAQARRVGAIRVCW